MKYYLCLIFLLTSFSVFGLNTTDNLIDELKNEIAKKNGYDNNKEIRIKKLKINLSRLSKNDYDGQFYNWNSLYSEYKSYQFDSAYVYIDKMISISKLRGDKPREYYSYVKMAFILLSSGMFHEAFSFLHKVDVKVLDNPARIDYYFFFGQV